MTPEARIQAAITILDDVISGRTAEQAMSNWGRRSRFAGSKDRAAVRDHVFQALRCKRSCARLGGGETGRALMIGALRSTGIPAEDVFSGKGYGPETLSEDETGFTPDDALRGEELDLQDWLIPLWEQSLGADAAQAADALKQRAPVHLRVNLERVTRELAIEQLAQEGVEATEHAAAGSALEVTEGARKIRNSTAYLSGLVELQDAASQAVVEALPLEAESRVLDFCAGGGGKSLAIAGRGVETVCAHDINPNRMSDIPSRAARAGAQIELIAPSDLIAESAFDLVLCDAPCSGSGSWRRDPEGKWKLTADRLEELTMIQAEILDAAKSHVVIGGHLAYATCSMLEVENTLQSASFVERNPEYQQVSESNWFVHQGVDGFYVAIFRRTA